ncbi:MAG: CGNR zinc finger domain-containing protein [Mesorhizobium sp.]|nr:CGNR zinc finger domain-containing protein [Mesorhizobium sp.]
METIWTRHRFSGGALALNVANSVVLRDDPAKRLDRFEDGAEIVRFAGAAETFCAEELGHRTLAVGDPDAARGKIIALREATDALFRSHALEGAVETVLLGSFLSACADALRGQTGQVWEHTTSSTDAVPFSAAVALSALALMDREKRARIRICANCGWLFLDASRNGSRLWCDMTVCGNRQKAKRHYRRHREQKEELHG